MAKAPLKADDGFTLQLHRFMEDRCARIKGILDKDEFIPVADLKKFIYDSAKGVFKCINPPMTRTADGKVDKRKEAWTAARGMLKELVDFNKFSPISYTDQCILAVMEKRVFEMLERYKTFVLTGTVTTKQIAPKLLGETDFVLCVDKPCGYLCSYGGTNEAPQLQGLESASKLLMADKAEIQIHEYLSLKYEYETAKKTREWWATGEKTVPCEKMGSNGTNPVACGKCGGCACTQGGCCNRLDRETSGVMVVAKDIKSFKVVRTQFQSEHSLEKGGTEKFYLALVHGSVKMTNFRKLSNDWEISENGDGRIRVDVAVRWNGRVSVPFDRGIETTAAHKVDYTGKPTSTSQPALSILEPVVWLKSEKKDGGHDYTLLKVQIITGRRHQIRFHCAEAGYPLVGDAPYGAPETDRNWCDRVFLHSYRTAFREPFTECWYQCCSPLPQDLGDVLETLTVKQVADNYQTTKLSSRRVHKKNESFMLQYDPEKPLMITEDAPKNKPVIDDSWAQKAEIAQSKTQQWGNYQAPAPAAATGIVIDWGSQKSAGGWGYEEAPPPKRLRVEYIPPANLEKVPVTPPESAAPAPARQGSSNWTRRASRSTPGVFYYWKSDTGETQAEPPPPWVQKESRSQPGVFYYWNHETGVTSVEKPAL